MVICPKWQQLRSDDRRRSPVRPVNLFRYSQDLHEHGRQLIRGWFQRAWADRNSAPRDSFEPFIFTWIAFNGWAVCVTNLDRDAVWKRALMEDASLNNSFERLLESGTRAWAEEFRAMWPIFQARRIRQTQIRFDESRQVTIQRYLRDGIPHEPMCWDVHFRDSEAIPLDWFHTLPALYQVRCNLFHGQKAMHVENDQFIVSRAYLVLVHFMRALLIPQPEEWDNN